MMEEPYPNHLRQTLSQRKKVLLGFGVGIALSVVILAVWRVAGKVM
jgi:hypothetical protein